MHKIVKTGVILWENASVQSHIFNPKGSISRLFRVKTLDNKAVSSVVFTTRLVHLYEQKVSSNLSKWFLQTPWTSKGCQTRYFLLAPIYVLVLRSVQICTFFFFFFLPLPLLTAFGSSLGLALTSRFADPMATSLRILSISDNSGSTSSCLAFSSLSSSGDWGSFWLIS